MACGYCLKDTHLSSEIETEEIAADEAVKVTFKELGLDPKIIKALDDMGYEKPTPIQARAIPSALEQRDVLGIAQTGTGKTGAFTLPTMHKLTKGRARARMPRCLIVCPTRELAPDIERIFKMTPFTRQVLFFSATMPNEIKRLVDQFLHQPVSIQVARKNMTAETVTQRIVRMPSSDPKQKRTALRWLIENENVVNGIVFCNRKRDVDIVAKSLNVHGLSAAPIHGDLAQSLRTKTLEDFKSGNIKLLVASDVAARGLDVPSVSHVFNYDVPNHSEDYVHRIGRTGRAGREGDAIMLVARLDEKNYDAILNLIKVKSIEEIDIPGIEDFPKDGGKRRRSGRDDKRGRGRGRNSDRNGKNTRRSGENVSKSRSDKSEIENDTKPQKTKSRRAASRRAAPKRKSDNSEKEIPKKADKAKTSPNKKKPSKAKDQKTRNEPRDKGKKRRYKNELDKNTEEGFGSSMPAFFKSSLK